MNDRVIKISALILSLFLICYVAVQAAAQRNQDYETQTVYEQTVTQSISVEGVFVREETVIPIDAGGVVTPLYSVGTKVAVNTKLGDVYNDQTAVRAQYQAQVLEASISALQRAQSAVSSTDVVRPDTLNGQAAEYVSQLAAARDSQNLSGLSEIKSGLMETMARRAIVVNGVENYDARISELQSELQNVQSLVSSQIHSFASTASGYFVDHVDGLEGEITGEYLDSLSASQLRDWLAGYQGYQADQSAVKIVTSHRWTFATTVTEEQMQTLSNISKVTLRFPGEEDIACSIADAQRDEASGLYKLYLEGDHVDEYLLSSRVQTAEIVVEEYSGLKIPKEAVRFVDDEMGVYVQTGSKIYFRYIDMIYETTDFILSAPYYQGGTDGSGYVKMYDTIVVKGKDLYDGKLVQ